MTTQADLTLARLRGFFDDVGADLRNYTASVPEAFANRLAFITEDQLPLNVKSFWRKISRQITGRDLEDGEPLSPTDLVTLHTMSMDKIATLLRDLEQMQEQTERVWRSEIDTGSA